MEEKNTILLTLNYQGESYPVQTRRGQHHSLMELISNHLAIPGFGICSGMGSCGTCLVHLRYPGSAVNRPVLACEVAINDELSNVQIIIPDKMY